MSEREDRRQIAEAAIADWLGECGSDPMGAYVSTLRGVIARCEGAERLLHEWNTDLEERCERLEQLLEQARRLACVAMEAPEAWTLGRHPQPGIIYVGPAGE